MNPKIVACSFIASGLRAFDISNVLHPREIGYFLSPTTPNTESGYSASDYAMSQPAFDLARHEIWYTDGGTGFYAVRVADAVWPRGGASPCPVGTVRLSGRSLGPVRLGMSHAQARRALSMVCGVSAVFPSRSVLRELSPGARPHLRGEGGPRPHRRPALRARWRAAWDQARSGSPAAAGRPRPPPRS